MGKRLAPLVPGSETRLVHQTLVHDPPAAAPVSPLGQRIEEGVGTAQPAGHVIKPGPPTQVDPTDTFETVWHGHLPHTEQPQLQRASPGHGAIIRSWNV